jgi:cell division protein YceG involved in septum cleavage
VRRIAIDRRHVTPRLTGAAYAAAVRKARPPAAFRAEAGTRVEGFLFPALYQFEEQTSAETLVANQRAQIIAASGRSAISIVCITTTSNVLPEVSVLFGLSTKR